MVLSHHEMRCENDTVSLSELDESKQILLDFLAQGATMPRRRESSSTASTRGTTGTSCSLLACAHLLHHPS